MNMEPRPSSISTQKVPAETPSPTVHPIDMEFIAIVSAGLYLHLNQLSVIDLKHSKLPGIQPNPASVLFVFSVLCVLAKSRPYWPSCLRRPPRLLRFVVEVFLTLYLTDQIVRQVWIPMLKFVNFSCNFLSEYLVVINSSVLATQMMATAQWTRQKAFYYIRFLLSLSMFYFMAEVTGLAEYLREAKFKLGAKAARSVTFAETTTILPPTPSNASARRSEGTFQSQPTPTKPQKRKQIRIIPKKYRGRHYASYLD